MRHLPRGLKQHQAAVGLEHVDAASLGPARERLEVAGGIVAEKAQVQPAPPLERPVAAPGVAAEPPEQAGDVPVEFDAPATPTRPADVAGSTSSLYDGRAPSKAR